MIGKGLGKNAGIGNVTFERCVSPTICFKHSIFLSIKTV